MEGQREQRWLRVGGWGSPDAEPACPQGPGRRLAEPRARRRARIAAGTEHTALPPCLRADRQTGKGGGFGAEAQGRVVDRNSLSLAPLPLSLSIYLPTYLPIPPSLPLRARGASQLSLRARTATAGCISGGRVVTGASARPCAGSDGASPRRANRPAADPGPRPPTRTRAARASLSSSSRSAMLARARARARRVDRLG